MVRGDISEASKIEIDKQNAENQVFEIERKIEELQDVIAFLRHRQKEIQLKYNLSEQSMPS